MQIRLFTTLEQPLDLPALLRWLAQSVEYSFDGSDWDAIRFGLFQRLDDPSVDEETQLELTYPFVGVKEVVELRLRWSPFRDDPGWIAIEIDASRSLTRQIETAVDVLNERAYLYSKECAADPLDQARSLLRPAASDGFG